MRVASDGEHVSINSAAARDPAMAASVHKVLNEALMQLADGDLGKPQTHGRKQTAAAHRKNDETAAGRDRAAESTEAPAGASAPAPEPELPVVPNAKTSASTKRRVTPGMGMRPSGNKGEVLVVAQGAVNDVRSP